MCLLVYARFGRAAELGSSASRTGEQMVSVTGNLNDIIYAGEDSIYVQQTIMAAGAEQWARGFSAAGPVFRYLANT